MHLLIKIFMQLWGPRKRAARVMARKTVPAHFTQQDFSSLLSHRMVSSEISTVRAIQQLFDLTSSSVTNSIITLQLNNKNLLFFVDRILLKGKSPREKLSRFQKKCIVNQLALTFREPHTSQAITFTEDAKHNARILLNIAKDPSCLFACPYDLQRASENERLQDNLNSTFYLSALLLSACITVFFLGTPLGAVSILPLALITAFASFCLSFSAYFFIQSFSACNRLETESEKGKISLSLEIRENNSEIDSKNTTNLLFETGTSLHHVPRFKSLRELLASQEIVIPLLPSQASVSFTETKEELSLDDPIKTGGTLIYYLNSSRFSEPSLSSRCSSNSSLTSPLLAHGNSNPFTPY